MNKLLLNHSSSQSGWENMSKMALILSTNPLPRLSTSSPTDFADQVVQSLGLTSLLTFLQISMCPFFLNPTELSVHPSVSLLVYILYVLRNDLQSFSPSFPLNTSFSVKCCQESFSFTLSIAQGLLDGRMERRIDTGIKE